MMALRHRTAAIACLIALGLATAVAQAVLLREAMVALGGSELAWGAVLALWLAGMGGGAWLGARGRGAWLAQAAPAIVLALAAVGVVLLRATPAMVGAVRGEVVATWRGAWVWAIAVVMPALAGGWSFPAAAGALGEVGEAAAAYGLESVGAMAGGLLFTFLLAPLGTAAALVGTLGVVLGLWLATRGAAWLAVAPLVLAAAIAGPCDRALERAGWNWSGRTGGLAAWQETRQQRLELAAGTPAALYADGRLVASFPDPYRAAARGHLAMLLHPDPRRVLVVGGLADGGLPAMLRHPVERLVVVEEDPALARLLPCWLGAPLAATLADTRVTVQTDEPLRVVARGGPWDLVVLFDPDPATLRRNRTRTVEFFRSCARALAPGGFLIVRVGVGDTYLGGAGGDLLAVLGATLHAAFPTVATLPGEEVWFVAGGEGARRAGDPTLLAERLLNRGIRDPEFSVEQIPLLVDPARAVALARFLDSSRAPLNRAMHPRVVLLAAALHEARGNPPLLVAARALDSAPRWTLAAALAIAAAALLLRGAGHARLGVEVAAVVGFSSMGWWLLLLTAWQATRGSVYSEVGALSAAFMGGVVMGTAWARRRQQSSGGSLCGVLVLGAGISLVMVAGVPLAWPRATIVPLLVIAGTLTGAAFPAVAQRCGAGSTRSGAGRGFAADEAGAALAALAVGLLILPWAGLAAAAIGLAGLQAAAALAVALAARRR